ncbi:unnamed protein product [Phytophthora fragariaefolia]|uniref:Unnamed protein product n=1 Tax=Phytophthora fragariaefolia TaxID=1490495 RepID=A0A9W6WW53_9STRA|nr:unnamed protein product [Phytophthora fragariaefolia]
MPLPLCTCSCALHGASPRSSAASSSSVQSVRDRDSNCNEFCIERDDCGAPESLAVSSPRSEDFNGDENYPSDDVAIEREETEAVIATLQLQVRALRKYKTNYELLCGQLGELNAQIGLQLQRHEADVAALQASIADFQTEKIALEAQVSEMQQALVVQRDASIQDREYSEHVHRQLGTAAELLKATENRIEQQEEHFAEEIERLRSQLTAADEEREEYQETAKRLEEEVEVLRARETEAREQEARRRRQEKLKHKKEVMARAAKLRAVSDELEAQRSAVRAIKKQLAQVQADKDTLRKQLVNVKRDGTHLTDIIDSQRLEHEAHTDELAQFKKVKKKLEKRIEVLTQEAGQLENDLADAREELADRNSELEKRRVELQGLRNELRQAAEDLGNVQRLNGRLEKQLNVFQRAENERLAEEKLQEQDQRANQERHYRKELVNMRELLADNQHRSTESAKDVQKLRRELLGVQKLLHGCAENQVKATKPIDEWDDVMRKSKISMRKSKILEQVRAFET